MVQHMLTLKIDYLVQLQSKSKQKQETLLNHSVTRPPIGAFFRCPEICAFKDFGASFLQPFPKSLATVEYYSTKKWPLIAVNGR